MTTVRLGLLGLFVVAIAACSTRQVFVPGLHPSIEAIGEFTTSNSICLKNGQPATDEVLFHNLDFRLQGYASLHAWTGSAISLLERELRKRGMTVSDGASKCLTLRITSVQSSTFAAGEKITLKLHVESSNGYSADYQPENSTQFLRNVQRQIDGVVMRGVVAMLNDPNIVEFLSETKLR